MVAAYKADIEEVYAGDQYGNNIVALYNPLNYIGADDTDHPTWTKIVMGASEGDMSMFNSLNQQIAWLNASVDAEIEWQWDGGHVPSEMLGNSFSLYVDQMYGEYAVSFTLADIATYRTAGASKAMPGFDVTDYGQEDYVFGNPERDARHWTYICLRYLKNMRISLNRCLINKI